VILCDSRNIGRVDGKGQSQPLSPHCHPIGGCCELPNRRAEPVVNNWRINGRII